MMKDRMLLEVTEVIDDSTGIWNPGEIEFGISGMLEPYLIKYGEEGKYAILNTLDHLKEAVKERYTKCVKSSAIPLNQGGSDEFFR